MAVVPISLDDVTLVEQDAQIVQAALGAASIGLFEFCPATAAFRGSRLACEWAGLGVGETLPLDRALDLVHPDDRETARTQWATSWREGRAREAQLRLRAPDGAYRWMRVCVARVEHHGMPRWCGTLENVDRAVAELRDSEQQLRLTLEAARMYPWQADLERDRFEPSAGARMLHGLAPESRPVTAAEVLTTVHPEDREVVSRRVVERDVDHALTEYRTVAPDGSVRWLCSTSRYQRDADGRLSSRLLGVVWDITERKASESAIAAVYDTSPLLIGVVELLENGDLRHVYDNPAVSRFFGVERGSTAGKRASDLGVDPETIAVWRRRYDAALRSGEPISFEYTHHSGAGPHSTLAVTVASLRQYGPTGRPLMCYLAEDVTSRRKTEQTLRQSEERLRLALQGASAGAWDWELGPDRVVWSAEMFELFGAPPGKAPQRFDDFMAMIDERDRAVARQAVETALEGRGPGFPTEFRVGGPDGGVRWLLALGNVLRSAAGTPLHIHGLILDITPRKQLEEALQRADRQKDEFLAILSHELRNPLAPIRTVARILGSPKVDDAQIAWSRQVIQRQVEHLALLLDDLLDVARITQGKLELKPDLVSVRTIIDPAIDVAHSVIEEKRHRLVLELPPQGTKLRVDALRISQVVSNLLTNAAKYTPPGGRIELRALADGDSLVFEVTDNGIGIPEDALPYIFDMFSQVKGAHPSHGGGLGIGLALAKGLVALHGGTIEARSGGRGSGSTFRVTLPGLQMATTEAAQGPTIEPAGCRRRVLVVDDNRDAADSLGMLLGLSGHEVRVAHGGIEAVRMAEQFRPDVCILDIGMPEMDGYDVARALRAEPWGNVICLIALTGWGQPGDKARAAAAGFDHHLTKPIDPHRVEAVIRGARQPASG
jgi:PAS domain S-box-containing protein